ncbi:MAG: endonuclease/exonuclease/phosphatase [Myxococcota bacterium]
MRLASLCFLLLAGCPPVGSDTGLPPPVPRPDDTDPPITGVELVVVGYNVESGDAEAATISQNVSEITGEALWGFSEVESQSWLDQFAIAAADDPSQEFGKILGTTGFSDRLGILWDNSRLELLGSVELDAINVGGTARAPLVGHFRVRENGVEFKFMVNHLWRTDDAARVQQAQMLNAWAASETLPLVAVGDYNFDWAVEGGEADHDAGYDQMVANSTWVWVRPDTLVATQCSFAFDGVLDFTFVGNNAKNWPSSSEVLFTQNVYCQDSPQKPDHRPVLATLLVPDP